MASGELSCTNISKRLNGLVLIRNVSVRVRKGACTVIIGANGAGKTITLRALSLVDPPTSGTVMVDDDHYEFGAGRQPAARPWPKVCIVFASPFLWPHLTVRQNIALVAKASRDVDEAFREIDKYSSQLALGPIMDRQPSDISRGEQQRASLLRALAARPDYLLLDEPTSNLSVDHIMVLSTILSKMRDEGRGVLITTHLLGLARRLADEVVYMSGGTNVESGKADILHNPKTPDLKNFVSLMEGI